MASGDLQRSWYRDDEIVVDKDGIPHFTGVMPELMREYRRRVLFAYNNLEGEGDEAAKEARDLESSVGLRRSWWTSFMVRHGGHVRTF